MSFESRNPATGEVVETLPELGESDIRSAIELSAAIALEWRRVPIGVRAEKMRTAARILRERKEAFGTLMAREMGKPLVEGEAESEKCAWVCEYYAENAERFLAPVPVETDARRSYVRFDPIGPVLAVMPWNFPFWQVFRFAAPALMAGNTGLLKHASNVPRCSQTIQEIFEEAGVPEGAFQSLLISSHATQQVIEHPLVRAATLTGSESAGASVASTAGRLLKKTVLELGGSDPFIVLDDAPLEETARSAARARCINSGQSCIAAKRFLVQSSVADRFVEAFGRTLQALRVGDPMDRGTQVGPLAREDLRIDLHSQVERSVKAGARLVTGGAVPEGRGWYYPPTLLDGVTPGMPAFDEETFGPVAAVIRFSDDEEAVELANRSRYGLGASLWSGDPDRAERLVERIEAGAVFVNGIVKSDPRLPFGGVKLSGYGRELSEVGIREFVNIKTVWLG